MPFAGNTRHKIIPQPAITLTSGQIGRWTLDKAGILAGIWLDIRGAVVGIPAAANALGLASIIRQVRVYLSTGTDLIQISGPGYHYIIRDYIEDYKDPISWSNARAAVAVGAYDISMFLPISINTRDMPGLILLQQERVTVQLSVEQETDAIVGGGVAVCTSVVTPHLEVFTVPPDPKDRPPFNLVHTWMEEQQVVAGAGDVIYTYPRGNTILKMLHGLGFAVAGADGWTQCVVRAQQNDRVYQTVPASQDLIYGRSHGRARPLGTISVDMFGSSGLGNFGSARDALVTQDVTSVASVITAGGAGNLYSIREEIVAVREPEGAVS
jgi:hypothetical protein